MNAAIRQRWQQLCARIDALSPRERALVFVGAVAVLVFAAEWLVFAPLARREAVLQASAQQQGAALAAANDDIAKQLAAYGMDPNDALRQRIAAVRADTGRMQDELRTMEKGLVPAERIAPLLEAILRANGRLKLVSLRSLPPDAIDGVDGAGTRPVAPADGKAPPKAGATILYRHGVELTVRGNYLDMVDYMGALEALPTQLFWGRAQLETETYPDTRLTLTLYTLSLDPKWMKL